MRTINDQLNSNENWFLLKFINRSFCVLKCDFGYVAYRNKQSRIIECNKSIFTLFTLEESDDGTVHLKGLEKKRNSVFVLIDSFLCLIRI
jgi:hypothetical protein